MNTASSFLSIEFEQKQKPINQWLGIAFLGIWCFWIVLYYTTEKAAIVGEYYSSNITQALRGQF